MNLESPFPNSEDDPARITAWLNFADDLFEAYQPDYDIPRALRHVLHLALSHKSSEIRCEALSVLQMGLVRPEASTLSLLPIAEKLANLDGEELLMALNVIGLSGDLSLAPFLTPFLTHADKYVRAEASCANSELVIH